MLLETKEEKNIFRLGVGGKMILNIASTNPQLF